MQGTAYRFRISILVSFLLIQLLDGVSTYFVITSGIAREANPIVRWLMDEIGFVNALIVAKIFASVAGMILFMADELIALLVLTFLYIILLSVMPFMPFFI